MCIRDRIIPGSPLSYWAGVEGENPMRYTGGLAGGSWVTALTSDLGGGKFDGAHPVSYTHLRAHETVLDLVCRLLLEKKQKHTFSKVNSR
mgnify:CR=1 FL=1